MEVAHIIRKIPGEQGEKLIQFNMGKLLAGDSAENLKLENDDRIIVYSYEVFRSKPTVEINGVVKKPGKYPLYEDMTLEDLILTAGGLSLEAFNVEAVIARSSRILANAAPIALPEETAITVPLPPDYMARPADKKTKLQVFDTITVRNLPGWERASVASIDGEVTNPGEYLMAKNAQTVSALVKKAGGLKSGAFPKGGVLFRRIDVIQMTPKSEQDPERTAVQEKMAIDLEKALANPGGPDDLVLKDGDRVSVPTNPGTVEVRGAVNRSAILQHKEGESLSYYVSQCGGFIKDADKSGIVVFLPNGTAEKAAGALFFRSNPRIPPGSVINVPFKTTESDVAAEKIEVRGAVKFPLSVLYRRGQKLDYYIRVCGGYRDEADIGNVGILNPEGIIITAKGIAPFNPIVDPGSMIDVPFKRAEKDAETDRIEVRGAVKAPSTVIHQTGQKLDDYIKMCGGYRDDADIEKVTVRLPDGKVLAAAGAAPFNPVIDPGSVIDVPVKK
jgi:protein involved in polysaccharide export with SLBB domain